MKKGFTLIELLIVMVVVTILVTVALPAYKTSMEKGRATEGIANAAAVSEAMNAFYIRNGNSYGTDESLKTFVLGNIADGGVAGITQSKNFDDSDISFFNRNRVNVTMFRKTGAYSITYTSEYGRVTSRTCSGSTPAGRKYCKAIGF